MSLRSYMILFIILLCISVINNVIMYYKCYVNNDINDPFVPENIGLFSVNIYYNKYNQPNEGIYKELKPHIEPFITNNSSKYVVTYGKPSSNDYQKMSKLNLLFKSE